MNIGEIVSLYGEHLKNIGIKHAHHIYIISKFANFIGMDTGQTHEKISYKLAKTPMNKNT